MAWRVLDSQYGLSPRVRGSLCGKPAATRAIRSIPASTGQPRPIRLLIQAIRQGLSPRVRGSLVPPVVPLRLEWYLGSIPASTGQPHPQSRQEVLVGFRSIPASTGQPGRSHGEGRFYSSRSIPASTGQPRSSQPNITKLLEGLSPRVRGSRIASQSYHYSHRSIPASTGQPWLFPE